MPNRYIREGLLDSEPLSKAGEKAEILFVRLMLVADDFGRFDGRVSVICRRCWPLGEPTDPDEVDILERLVKLTEQQLVVAYEVDGKPFIYIPKFKQRTRATKSKYPEPVATYPQDAGPLSVKRQTEDGPKTVKWQAADSPPQAVSGSVSYSSTVSGEPDGRSTSTPKAAAHSMAKANKAIQESRHAAKIAADPTPNFFENLPNNLKRVIAKGE